jgi:DNA-binding response OmpR family regulator
MSYAGDTISTTTTTTDAPALPRRRRQILLVEDEGAIRELLRLHLSLAGFDVEELADGASALERARGERFDLIVLDLMLPRLDGLTVCRALRAQGANAATPILMLTARDTESDRVLGLESGADDYLTKPFGIRELLARIGAILRRCDRNESLTPAPARRVQSRDVMLDAERRAAVVRGTHVDLTRQEFDLLYLLAGRPGIVFSRAALLSKVWSDDIYVTERTIDTVVSRLRKKIERNAQDPELILTAWGVGYKFADAA